MTFTHKSSEDIKKTFRYLRKLNQVTLREAMVLRDSGSSTAGMQLVASKIVAECDFLQHEIFGKYWLRRYVNRLPSHYVSTMQEAGMTCQELRQELSREWRQASAHARTPHALNEHTYQQLQETLTILTLLENIAIDYRRSFQMHEHPLSDRAFNWAQIIISLLSGIVLGLLGS